MHFTLAIDRRWKKKTESPSRLHSDLVLASLVRQSYVQRTFRIALLDGWLVHPILCIPPHFQI